MLTRPGLIFWPAAIITVALLIGCRSPQHRVAEQMHDLRAEWHTNLVQQAAQYPFEITWPEALAQMRQHNLRLRQARVEVTNSQEAVRQIFRDLTPTLNLRAGMSKRLEDISNITFDDVTFSADSFFNIPGLVSFGARLYTARLFQLRSETAYELTEREQTIELFRLFHTAQEIQEHRRHLQRQETIAQAIGEVDPFTGRMMLTQTELRQLAAAREMENLQQRAGEIFGDRSWHWVFATNGLPDLRYHADPLPLDDTNRVAQLQMKLVALELEAARVQILGIKLRYWPELNLSLTSPPLYQRAAGRERFWDAGEIRASANVFWYLDTRGHVGRQLRQTRRQQVMQRDRIHQESLALIDRLLFTQGLLEETIEKSRQIDFQLEMLEAIPPAQDFFALQKYADDHRALIGQQRQLRREIADLNTVFWFLDEEAWPAHFGETPLAHAQ